MTDELLKTAPSSPAMWPGLRLKASYSI